MKRRPAAAHSVFTANFIRTFGGRGEEGGRVEPLLFLSAHPCRFVLPPLSSLPNGLSDYYNCPVSKLSSVRRIQVAAASIRRSTRLRLRLGPDAHRLLLRHSNPIDRAHRFLCLLRSCASPMPRRERLDHPRVLVHAASLSTF